MIEHIETKRLMGCVILRSGIESAPPKEYDENIFY